jgi:riboflavin synthase
MFTGIITAIGRITDVHNLGKSQAHGKRLTIAVEPSYLSDVGLGDSIALNGACMTVTSFDASQGVFTIDISAESLEKTCGLDQNNTINLEKALRAHDRLGGHLVSGHVDGKGLVRQFHEVGESWLLAIEAPQELARFVAYKGSITVNGVSLTVNSVSDESHGCVLSINLIPHTIDNTALGQLKPGHGVNLEIDLIARYVERMLNPSAPAAPSH